MQQQMLTAQQIESLYRFCKKHYVHHYDVQTELVDHLATAIEEKMQQQPGIAFEQALDEVYKGFGYSGFAKIVAARTSQMQKRHNQLRRRFFFSYFTWPKIGFTLFLLAALYTLLQQLPVDYLQLTSIIMFGVLQVLNYRLVRQLNKYRKQLQAELLLVEGVSGPVFLFVFWQLYFYMMVYAKEINWLYAPVGMSAVLMLSLLFVLAVLSVLSYDSFSRSLYTEARQRYPAAFKEV